jgi:hypothetical protein
MAVDIVSEIVIERPREVVASCAADPTHAPEPTSVVREPGSPGPTRR